MPTDFSSQTYWQTRFLTEKQFEWLTPSSKIIPKVLEIFEDWSNTSPVLTTSSQDEKVFRVLHLGCGTSSLGDDVYDGLLKTASDEVSATPKVEVVDCDYVPSETRRNIPFIQLNLLDLKDLIQKSGKGWDLVIDKSTADAISCGPSMLLDDEDGNNRMVEPMQMLCRNLGCVVKGGGRWICVSYSATRFDFLSKTEEVSVQQQWEDRQNGKRTVDIGLGGKGGRLGEQSWKVVEKRMIASSHLPEGRIVKDGIGERVVYEPETGIWCYTLERS